MSGTHPKVDAHFDKISAWREEQAALRQILLASPLTEDFK